jgi:hypothetical protein
VDTSELHDQPAEGESLQGSLKTQQPPSSPLTPTNASPSVMIPSFYGQLQIWNPHCIDAPPFPRAAFFQFNAMKYNNISAPELNLCIIWSHASLDTLMHQL